MAFSAGRPRTLLDAQKRRVSYAENIKKHKSDFCLKKFGRGRDWRRDDDPSISSEGDTEEGYGPEGGSPNGIQPNHKQYYDSYDSTNSEARRPSRLLESCRFIWSPKDLATSLRSLPGGEMLWLVLEAGTVLDEGSEPGVSQEAAIAAIEDAVSKGYGETALLVSAWCARPDLIKRLLEQQRIDAWAVDSEGRSALHLACCAGDDESVKALLRFGAKADTWDNAHVATPLHCAACSGSPQCISLLLETGIDLNLGIEGKTPLYHAVQANSLDSVRQLLQAGANPNNPQVYTETPLHVAAAFGYSECLKLLLDNGADVRVQFGPSKATALHLAAQDGNADCTRLLLDSGADTGATNNRMQTPLHLAALAQSTDTLELLLQRGADINAMDADLRTPLHCAIVKESRSCECVRMLLVNGANFNCADAFGYTPLHLAALHEFSGCVAMLINAGADVMARTNGGVSALTFVVRRTPDTLPCFIERFDSSVMARDHDIGDADCEIRMDFRSLLPPLPPFGKKTESFCDRRGESSMLLGFIEVGMRHMLKHPLCETFLFLKWRRIRKFFLISLAFHLIFVAHYTAYIVGVFFRLPMINGTHCWNATEEVKFSENFRVELSIIFVGYVLMALNVGLMAKEIFQIAHGFVIYANHWENWLQWLIILSVFGTHGMGHYSICNIKDFQHHVAAVGIVFTWTDLMVLIGRFPTFGVYVQMFTTVSINFSKFLFAYFCLLVGFGLGLGVLFPSYPSFKEPHFSLLKSVIMMSGELEFEDIFFNNQSENPITFGGTSHVMFLAFVILVTVILTNLLVGLAVSDIQGLQKTARLNRLVRQAELISHLESILFSRLLLKVIPIGLLKPCLKSALLVSSSPYNSSINLRPNDPREKRLPRYLLEAAYNLVVSRSGRRRRYKQDPFRGSSRRSAYKSWAMQCSFSRRSTSIDREESEAIVQQNQMMDFISSQITNLVAESEARDSVLEDILKKMASVEKSLTPLQSGKGIRHGETRDTKIS